MSQREYGKLQAEVSRSNLKMGYGRDIRAERTYEEQVRRETDKIRRKILRDKEDRERYIIPEYQDVAELLSIPLDQGDQHGERED